MMSDDDKDILCRAFPVEHDGEEFDLDIPPTSGQEYLRRVQIEAQKCPAVVVSDIDTKAYNKKQTFKVVGISGLHPAPRGYSPSITWQREQTASFSSIRQKFGSYKMRLKKAKGKHKIKLPSRNDVSAWCQLCFGRLRASSLPARLLVSADRDDYESGMSDSHSDNEANTTGTASTGEGLTDRQENGTPPLLSIVSHMDQPTIIQVLEYHVNWFEATGFTPEQGRWFYALLTSLEKPLDPETCSLLRNLAKNCANLRASLESSSDPRLAPLNLLICLVARYFDQSDLADR